MQAADLPQHFLQHDDVEEIVEYVEAVDETGEAVHYEEWSGQDLKDDINIKQEIIPGYVEDDAQYFEQEYEEMFEEEIDVDETFASQFEEAPSYNDPYIEFHDSTASSSKKLTIVECEICGSIIKHPSKIQAHMRTHTGEKPFQCDICGMRFTQKTPMVNHYRKHVGDMPYVCGFGCGKRFVNNARKNAHELRHQGMKRQGPPRPYLKPPRRKIGTEVSNTTKIEASRYERAPEERCSMIDWYPPFGQLEQPMSAASSKRLDEVIEAVASGVSIPTQKQANTRASVIAQCHICGLMVKYPSKIQAHMRTHTGEKPFECKECGARFATASPLKMHMKRKHLEERKIPCSWECGRMFVSIGARNEHERIVHAGIKRYECTAPGCRKMFTRRQYLMLHRMKDHHMYAPVFDPNEIIRAEVEDQNASTMIHGDNGDYITEYTEDDQFEQDMVDISENGLLLVTQDTSNDSDYVVVEGEQVHEENELFVKVEDSPQKPTADTEMMRSDDALLKETSLTKHLEETVKHVLVPGKDDQGRVISVRILKRSSKKPEIMSLACNLCPFRCYTRDVSTLVDEANNFCCIDRCSSFFNSPSNFWEHLHIKHGAFKCNHCGKIALRMLPTNANINMPSSSNDSEKTSVNKKRKIEVSVAGPSNPAAIVRTLQNFTEAGPSGLPEVPKKIRRFHDLLMEGHKVWDFTTYEQLKSYLNEKSDDSIIAMLVRSELLVSKRSCNKCGNPMKLRSRLGSYVKNNPTVEWRCRNNNNGKKRDCSTQSCRNGSFFASSNSSLQTQVETLFQLKDNFITLDGTVVSFSSSPLVKQFSDIWIKFLDLHNREERIGNMGMLVDFFSFPAPQPSNDEHIIVMVERKFNGRAAARVIHGDPRSYSQLNEFLSEKMMDGSYIVLDESQSYYSDLIHRCRTITSSVINSPQFQSSHGDAALPSYIQQCQFLITTLLNTPYRCPMTEIVQESIIKFNNRDSLTKVFWSLLSVDGNVFFTKSRKT
ncbi:unnamed protein product [Auanema sp. JU1783]|nr:unnamed protein product [Auanema sp. JU1783]